MKITVIGELCEDIFVYGETKRLSPEAPVPVFNPFYTDKNPGMAGNVVENLKPLDLDIEVGFIHQNKIITKTRFVDYKSNHMFIRVDEGENNVEPLILTEEIIEQIKESDAVIISDYNKGFLDENVLFEISYHSRFIIMDTKKKISEKLVPNFNFIKLNEHEYTNFDSYIKILHSNKLIVTLGSKGAKYMDELFPSNDPKETIDVSGAGDTFTASFTLKYLETKNIKESIVHANEMAAIVVSKRGVSTPWKKQLSLDQRDLLVKIY
jgi:D-beta-D-heptose 7-phosphate kinase/D-beta-D-heptose 1-phosphate adenosyltransferase